MKFIPVIPSHLINCFPDEPVMILAHQLKGIIPPVLKEREIYLDNGAHENSLVSFDLLYKYMKKINPKVLFLPDVMFDSQKTISSTELFLCKYWKKKKKTRFVGIPQGKTLKEYTACLKLMERDPRIDWIGVNYKCPLIFFPGSKNHSMARYKLIKVIKPKKPLHLLGFGGGFYEKKLEKDFNIESMDSVAPFKFPSYTDWDKVTERHLGGEIEHHADYYNNNLQSFKKMLQN